MAYHLDGVDVVPVRVPIVSVGPMPHTSMCPLSLPSVSALLHPVITFCTSLSEPNPSFACLPIPQMFRESHVISLLSWAGQRIDCLDHSYRAVWFSPTVGVSVFTNKMWHWPPKHLRIVETLTLIYSAYIACLIISYWKICVAMATRMTPVYPQAVRVYLSLKQECLDKRWVTR